MRSSILREIEKMKGLTHALILTHNVDFFFIQGLLLRALKSAGSPSLSIFADAERAATTFAGQGNLASGLGQRYRLVPVTLASGGRFHPKAVLLAGVESAVLYVGSGNLTFGGWCDNGEVWNRFRTEDDEGAAISAFRAYLEELLGLLPMPETLRVELETAFSLEGTQVPLDVIGMRRVLLNLVGNAIDACGEPERRVTITTERTQEEAVVQVTVADTGCGMDEEQLGKIFQPFYSSKGSKGTGLGLAVVKKIVEEHGGRVHVQSEVGIGTTFAITLPVRSPAQGLDERQRGSPTKALSEGRCGQILISD